MSGEAGHSLGRIVLAATPIGDARDASARLLGLLETADVIAAEDTRRLRRLCERVGVTPRGQLVAHHEHNEAASARGLIERALAGATVLLVSDAGMPAVSDPGYRLVQQAIEAGVPVTSAPGPSAVLAALAVSGLPTDRFSFEGFVPRKPGERGRALAALAEEARTMVFFEAPHRLAALLMAMVDVFGAERSAVVCRELTKTHEEVLRGSLGELADWAQGEVLGEITVVVAGFDPALVSVESLLDRVEALQATGVSLREATKQVAAGTGFGARDLYQGVLNRR